MRGKTLKDFARPGDLLFYRVTPRSRLLGRLIAMFQLLRGEGSGSVQYSHVAILAGDKKRCIEARWPMVRISNVDWSHPELEVWRVPMSRIQASMVLIYARTMVGDWYDIWGLIIGKLDSHHRAICTTVVRKAFASMGIEIGAGAGDILTPNELVADPALQFIGKVIDEPNS